MVIVITVFFLIVNCYLSNFRYCCNSCHFKSYCYFCHIIANVTFFFLFQLKRFKQVQLFFTFFENLSNHICLWPSYCIKLPTQKNLTCQPFSRAHNLRNAISLGLPTAGFMSDEEVKKDDRETKWMKTKEYRMFKGKINK